MHKNKIFFLALFLLVFSSGLFFSIPQASIAAGFNYQLLEKIPGQNVGGNDLSQYILAIYNTALVIVVLSAVLMLSIGGFMYLTSAGNTAAMGTAKGVIFDAVIGLAIALAAWLLLNVINPDLVNVKIKSLSIITAPGAPGAPLIPPGGAWPDDSSERASLGTAHFHFNNNNCKTVGEQSCTSMSGSAAISGLKELQSSGGIPIITINGGTEYWLHGENTHHKPGDYGIDIAHEGVIDSWIKTPGNYLCDYRGRPMYKIGNAVFWNEDSSHWHANFNQSSCSAP